MTYLLYVCATIIHLCFIPTVHGHAFIDPCTYHTLCVCMIVHECVHACIEAMLHRLSGTVEQAEEN